MLDAKSKMKRFCAVRTVPGWLWRLAASLLLGGLTFFTAVPWAAAQRGNAAIGGEHLLVLTAFVLPFCIFNR